MYWLVVVAYVTLPLPAPGSDPNAPAILGVGLTALPFSSLDSCEAAKLWFKRNLHRDGGCLKQ